MTIAPANDDKNDVQEESCAAVPAHAIVMLVAGMAAAWFAAGSTGLLARPLQHALTWLALAVALVAAWPEGIRRFGTWAILAGGAILGLFFTASALPTINVLAVAVVLAAIAQVSRGLTGRVAMIAALGATVLGCFRFACASIPTVWLAADGLGWVLGRLAGWMAGCRLEVGVTFGGIDFLVLTAAIYAGWIVCTVPPTSKGTVPFSLTRKSGQSPQNGLSPSIRRALWVAAAIIAGHFVYLIVLAYSEKLLAILPAVVPPPKSDASRVGLWTWTNGLRTLIPWNVPLLAMFIHGGIVAAMVAGSSWIPIVEVDPEKLKRQKAREDKEEVPGAVLLKGVLFHFGPALLAVAATLLGALAINQPDLKGKKIVAYERGYLNWLKPEYDSALESSSGFGMLPVFVESLGAKKFVKSKDLSKADLADADVLLLIHPDEPWPKETLERVWDYVRGGGSLLLVAEPAIYEGKNSFNDVLQPLSMEVRFDTAVTRSGNWEQSYEITSHPATSGIDDLRNRFGVQLGSSIRTRWPARPTLVGRWGWSDPGSDAVLTGGPSYNAGERLGDLILAAEQPFGRGRVFVLGDTSPLQNGGLPNAFPFTGRLLSYLAHRPSSPQALWRQFSTLAALVAMVGLLAGRPAGWQAMLTSTVMAVSLLCCTAVGYWSGRVLPDGRLTASGAGNKVAYIDASHVEAYDSDSQTNRKENHGISELMRTLMRQGYLPLLAPELMPDRLGGCGLLISIAPAREFSFAERDAVKQFVSAGGTFVCMVGAEESRASAPLLADFGFRVPHTPVLPGENATEPAPLGPKFPQKDQSIPQYRYYAAWPVECDAVGAKQRAVLIEGISEHTIVITEPEQGGTVIVIGDTHFGSNENFSMGEDALVDFWRWLLSGAVPSQKKWNPPPGGNVRSSGGVEEDSEGTTE
jgi:hypothetical protein